MAIGGLGGFGLAGLSGIAQGLEAGARRRGLEQVLQEYRRKQEWQDILGSIPGSEISALFGSPSALGAMGGGLGGAGMGGGFTPAAALNPAMAGGQPPAPGTASTAQPQYYTPPGRMSPREMPPGGSPYGSVPQSQMSTISPDMPQGGQPASQPDWSTPYQTRDWGPSGMGPPGAAIPNSGGGNPAQPPNDAGGSEPGSGGGYTTQTPDEATARIPPPLSPLPIPDNAGPPGGRPEVRWNRGPARAGQGFWDSQTPAAQRPSPVDETGIPLPAEVSSTPADEKPYTPPTGADAAPAPADQEAGGGGDATGGGTGLMATMPGGARVPLDQLLGKHVDLGQVQSLIQRLRPDASPGATWGATAELFKQLNSGGKLEQLQSAQLLKYLGVIQGVEARKDLGEKKITSAEKQTADKIEGARSRQERGIASKEDMELLRSQDRRYAVDQRTTAMRDRDGNISIRQTAAIADRAARDASVNARAGASQRLSAIRARIAAIQAQNPGDVPSPLNRAALEQIAQELADLTTPMPGTPAAAGTPPAAP